MQVSTMTTPYSRLLPLLALSFSLAVSACSSSDESAGRDFDPARMFQRMDRDQDGLISWDEFKDGPEPQHGTRAERFQRMDSDADGYVTLDEFVAAAPGERPRGGRGDGRGGGRGGMRVR